MNKTKVNKYKSIYNTQVIPKKSIKNNTYESYISDIKILDDFSDLRKRANQVCLDEVDYEGESQ